MTRTLVPFSSRTPLQWGDFEREMEDMMRRLVDWDAHGNSGDRSLMFAPNLNVSETESRYEVTVDLPGMKPEEVTVEFKDDSLWITGERKSETKEKDKTYHHVERLYGSFRRTVRLGADVNPESIEAKYKDGVLKVTATKSEAACPKRIEVHA